MDTAAGAIDSSIRPQVVGWWILAGLAALAGIVVVGPGAGPPGRHRGRTQRHAERSRCLAAPAGGCGHDLDLVIAVGGATGGVALAFLLSPLTPVGEARLADPSAGFTFDALALLPGAAAAVVVVLAVGLWPAIRAARTPRPAQATGVAHPSRIVAALAGAGAPPSALIGVRHALNGAGAAPRCPAGPALLGSVLAVTALCATVVFGASLTHLTGTPALYGQPFDLWLPRKRPRDATQFGQLVGQPRTRPGHLRHQRRAGGDVSINGRIVEALAGQSIRGQALVTTVSGHLPRAAGSGSAGRDHLAPARGAHRVTRAGDRTTAQWRDPHRLVPGGRDDRLPARLR